MAEGKEDPEERSAGGPGVERGEEGDALDAEPEERRDGRQEEANGGERWDRQQEDGVLLKGGEVGRDEEHAGEQEGGENGEEAGIPELLRIEIADLGGALRESECEHEADGDERSEGREGKVSDVEEAGVHWIEFSAWGWGSSHNTAKDRLDAKKPIRWAVRRSAGEPV